MLIKKQDKRVLDLLPMAELTSRARQAQAEGKYREAIDYFKALNRREQSAQFVPELIACYKSLAETMRAKGHFADAEVIGAHIIELEKLAGAGLAPSGISSSSRENVPGRLKNAVPLSKLLGTCEFQAAAESALLLFKAAGGNTTADCKAEYIDAWVLYTGELPGLEQLNPSLAQDRKWILAALDALSGQFTAGSDDLYSVSRNSPFAAWKMFIKGWQACQQGQSSKALTLFKMIEPGAVPYEASKPFRFLLEPKPVANSVTILMQDSGIFEQITTLLDESEWARVLPRAHQLWAAKKYRDSYQISKDKVADFPVDPAMKAGLSGAMTHFYFNSIAHLERGAVSHFVDLLIHLSTHQKLKNKFEGVCAAKAVCHYYGSEQPPHVYSDAWDILLLFLNGYFDHSSHDESERRTTAGSLIYGHLSEYFLKHLTPDPESPFAQKAIEYAEKAIEAAPENQKHFQTLYEVYERLGLTQKCNQVLEKRVSSFPDDKNVLWTAGNACVERHSFIKGIKYLTRAFELDPTDSQVLDSLLDARFQAASEFFKSGSVSKARPHFEEAIRIASQSIQPRLSYFRSIPLIHARWAACELAAGFKKEFASQMDLMRAVADPYLSPLEIQYTFLLLLEKSKKTPESQMIRLDFEKNCRAQVSIPTLLALIRALKQVEKDPKKESWHRKLAELVDLCEFKSLLRKRSQMISKEDATQLFEFMGGQKPHHTLTVHVQGLVERMLADFPNDVRYQVFQFGMKSISDTWGRPDELFSQLEKLLELAKTQRDSFATQRVQEMIDDFRSQARAIFESFDSDFEDEGEDDFNPFDFPFSIPQGGEGRWCANCQAYHPL